jgi:hypothetical protein
MRHKRMAAAEVRAATRQVPETVALTERAEAGRASAAAAERARELDVTPWLRRLGFRADEARRAAEFCERLPDASLEERVRAALSLLGGPRRRVGTG